MDYKALLSKYMDHVRQCEGADFTDRLNHKPASEVFFTEEEAAELVRLSDSLRNPPSDNA